jgi:hypothetical protein
MERLVGGGQRRIVVDTTTPDAIVVVSAVFAGAGRAARGGVGDIRLNCHVSLGLGVSRQDPPAFISLPNVLFSEFHQPWSTTLDMKLI